MGTFTATGLGLYELISSEDGSWHELWDILRQHQLSFYQVNLENGLGVGGTFPSRQPACTHPAVRYHRCGFQCPGTSLIHLIIIIQM